MTRLLWAFVVWTLFIWFNRMKNVLEDNMLSTNETVTGAVIAMAFLIIAASIPMVSVGARRFLDRYVSVVAAIAATWWLVRLFTNLIGDHSVGFKVVHTVLSLVTIGLSLAVIRSHTSRVRIPTEPDAAGSI